jgi:hypothetical protein
VTIDEEITERIRTRDLRSLFLDVLGWDQPGIPAFSVEVEGTSFNVATVGQKRGLHVLEFSVDEIPRADVQHRLDLAVSPRAPERVLVFTSDDRQVWRWPEPRKSGGTRLVPQEIRIARPSPGLVQRLAGVRFRFAEEDALTLPAVKDRVRAQFNAEQVTNRFYERFQTQHESLQGSLEGVPDEDLRRWYASLLMNRLVFIYFLQKKGFLNGDREYLRTCLRKVRGFKGDDEFYAFYRTLLLPMFHHGFGSFDHNYPDEQIAAIVGDVPYVNGGIFEEHEIESAHDIAVPDAMFESIFDFFDGFTWHLDDRPHGDPNAINPDVIGYIVERYINLTTTGKKEGGAYYTKEDVTGYMVAATLVPRLLERIIKQTSVNPFVLLQADPVRYVPEAMQHGRDPEGSWHPVPYGAADAWPHPERWIGLAALAHDESLQLPGESWVETLDRRGHVDELITDIRAGQVNAVDELVTRNLDARTLLADVIHNLDSALDVAVAWKETTATRVIDPTCGSGAFLFAALDVLDDVYAALLERARTHLATNDKEARQALGALVATADAHPNDAYYRRKHAALSNLHGLDIMREAVETAKLRLFLALASKLERREEIEPLPDLDFNLRAGNLLVGFFDIDDARTRVGATTFDALGAVDRFIPKAEHVAELRRQFLLAQDADDPAAVLAAKRVLSQALEDVKPDADRTYAAASGVDVESLGYEKWWEDSQPFHWMVEFPQILSGGGFDVVVGNPPYVDQKHVPYTIDGYKTAGLRDIFAPCVERSLQLLHKEGRLALILPISFQFSSRYQVAREVVLAQPCVWTSTYSRNPSALFTAGLGVRNTIIATSPHESAVHTTETRRWQRKAREHLFQTLRYAALDGDARVKAWLPRTGDAAVARLLQSLRRRDDRLGTSVSRKGQCPLGFKVTALYYLPVYTRIPPVYDKELRVVPPPKDSAINFRTKEDQLLAFVLFAGELGLVWWMSTGDDFDVTGQTFKEFPVGLAALDPAREHLLALARELEDAVHVDSNLLFTPYAGLMTGSWDLRRVRQKTREIDRVVLNTIGLREYEPAILRAVARFSKSTGERPGTQRGSGWLEGRQLRA